jgi:dTDP-glucose 4,6-dehydratase
MDSKNQANRLLITGGAGFIGSAVVRQAVAAGFSVLNVDKLTYAASLDSIRGADESPNYEFVHADVANAEAIRAAINAFQPDAVIHLAAESHVDRSIDGPAAFIESNIVGSFVMLNEARRYWAALPTRRAQGFRFVQVSTDEVFGSLGAEGVFNDSSAYAPNSPYSASKAAGDHLARAWYTTYGLPVVVTNCSNNFGPYQFPEKLIPLAIGDGMNVRDWLYVEDHAAGLLLAAGRGTPGATYLFGARSERTNVDVVRALCASLDELHPRGAPHGRLQFVTDRPGHDRRYAIDPVSAEQNLGWRPASDFESGIRETVRWYLENRDWANRVQRGKYAGERLGTAAIT